MSATRTLNPLHFEDLEPHRFEDLIRQLLYDFRDWQSLEATGRAGSDDGFDVRASEKVPPYETDTPAEDDAAHGEEDAEVGASYGPPTRLWLVQCKREKTIGPAKIAAYVRSAAQACREHGGYGLLLAAACDFSTKARNAFREEARQGGFSEAHLWGKAEIEDLLLQPKNDHLLFAYFGISLQIRRRTTMTAVRARLSTKRKARRHLRLPQFVLVRDATDDRYPYLDTDESKDRSERGRWLVVEFKDVRHDGIHFLVGRHRAYLEQDGDAWDFDERENVAEPRPQENPWATDKGRAAWAKRSLITNGSWSDLPDDQRAWYERVCVIPFECVVEIDPEGDDIFQGPHVYVVTPPGRGPWTHEFITLETIDQRQGEALEERRVRWFCSKEPEIPSG